MSNLNPPNDISNAISASPFSINPLPQQAQLQPNEPSTQKHFNSSTKATLNNLPLPKCSTDGLVDNPLTVTISDKPVPPGQNSPLLEPITATFDSKTHNAIFKNKTLWRQKGVLVLVGLPARGKSYIAFKIVSYLRWRGYKADLFNVGKFRRQMVTVPQGHDFFSAQNEAATKQRNELAMGVLNKLLDWLEEGGDLAVFDATNTTRKRRSEVVEVCKARDPNVNVVFIESFCDDKRVLESNYIAKAMGSPDYKNLPLEEALADLKLRVAEYEKVYEPLSESNLSYLSLINLNSKIICNRINGSMMHSITSYLMSIHIAPRPIYLVRAGHVEQINNIFEGSTDPYPSKNGNLSTSSGNVNSNELKPANIPFAHSTSIGAHLDKFGQSFSDRLTSFIAQKSLEYFKVHGSEWLTDDSFHSIGSQSSIESGPLPLVCYTSTLPRAMETAATLSERAVWSEAHSSLNMMDTGVCAGLSFNDMKSQYPEIIEKWMGDKFNFRFPGGESQRDKARSLVPLIIALEGQRYPTLVVSHLSTLLVLYGYFLGLSCPPSEYNSLTIPQHTVIELRPKLYGWQEIRYDLSKGSVQPSSSHSPSTPQPKPKPVNQVNESHGQVEASPGLAQSFSFPHSLLCRNISDFQSKEKGQGQESVSSETSQAPIDHGTQFYAD